MTDNTMKGMVALMGVVMMAGVLQMMLPKPVTPEPGGFQCPYCSASFVTLSELINHITEEQPDEPPFEEVDIGWGD